MSTTNLKYYNTAINAAQSGDIPAARTAIESALTEDPNDVQSWQLYGVVLNALGETEKAEKAVAKVKELGVSEADELIMKAADAIGLAAAALARPRPDPCIIATRNMTKSVNTVAIWCHGVL